MRTLNAITPVVLIRHPLIFTTGLLGLIIVGSAFLATRETTKGALVAGTQEAGVPVKTATVTHERLPLQITAVGTADAYSSASVNSDVDGQLTDLRFKEGQYVKKGEPLFIVDCGFSHADLEQARANHSGAVDQQQRAEADLSKDRAAADAADAEADRYDALDRDGVISKEEDERTRTIANELEALVKSDQDEVARARESVTAVQESVHSSTVPDGYHSIRSPIDGLVATSVVKRGDTVMANDGTPLATIEQVSPIYVSFAVPAPELPDIDRCMSKGELQVSATIVSESTQLEHGSLGPIAYATISDNGTASLKATFDNKDRRLLPGQPVNVVLTLETAPDAAVIPTSAVQTDEHGQYVFVVKSDYRVESRPVVVAETVGDKAVLASGLEPGEIVVADARFPLTSGSTVIVSGEDQPLVNQE